MIEDRYGRTFKTLRISLTNSCNLACHYCVDPHKENHPENPSGKRLELDDYVKAVGSIHKNSPLGAVRLTGGEPLLFKNISELVRRIKEMGIPEVKLTTNGVFLKGKAKELREAGLTSVNVSLDAAGAETFFKVTRRKNFDRVIQGIDESIFQGMEVKLNAVIMRRINDDQIVPLLSFARERGIVIRYLELMRMGYIQKAFDQFFFSQDEILSEISGAYPFRSLIREKSSTANYWVTDDGQKFGIIANESEPFCSDCDRLRIDSLGNIYGCLSNPEPIPFLEHLNNEGEVENKLKTAMAQKQILKFAGSELSMQYIGG
jgi:cyclic pyranopterin phosphate synthase